VFILYSFRGLSHLQRRSITVRDKVNYFYFIFQKTLGTSDARGPFFDFLLSLILRYTWNEKVLNENSQNLEVRRPFLKKKVTSPERELSNKNEIFDLISHRHRKTLEICWKIRFFVFFTDYLLKKVHLLVLYLTCRKICGWISLKLLQHFLKKDFRSMNLLQNILRNELFINNHVIS
jgi:hypothetical protein